MAIEYSPQEYARARKVLFGTVNENLKVDPTAVGVAGAYVEQHARDTNWPHSLGESTEEYLATGFQKETDLTPLDYSNAISLFNCIPEDTEIPPEQRKTIANILYDQRDRVRNEEHEQPLYEYSPESFRLPDVKMQASNNGTGMLAGALPPSMYVSFAIMNMSPLDTVPLDIAMGAGLGAFGASVVPIEEPETLDHSWPARTKRMLRDGGTIVGGGLVAGAVTGSVKDMIIGSISTAAGVLQARWINRGGKNDY